MGGWANGGVAAGTQTVVLAQPGPNSLRATCTVADPVWTSQAATPSRGARSGPPRPLQHL